MSWFAVFVGFCLLIVLHEAGHFFAAKATGMRVEKFFLFFGPKIWSVKRGETEYGIAAIPLGGYVKITGMNPEEDLPPEVAPRAYYHQPVWKRIVVIAAGPAVNIILAFIILTGVYLYNANQVNQEVGSVTPGSPAAKLLQPGDEVVAVDGKRFAGLDREQRLERFGEQVASHECAGQQVEGCKAATPVELTVRRDGELTTFSVRPEYSAENKRALIGFSYGSEPEDIGFGTAADRSLDAIWMVTERTATIFARIFESEQREQLSGVVGVSDVGHHAVETGLTEALLLLALVSLSLGIVNLLPILPLDGGHIFWSVVEKLRGRPVSLRVMERASIVGFALVAMLFFIGLSNDLGRLGTDPFENR
jgi:regulator of sigma E protease